MTRGLDGGSERWHRAALPPGFLPLLGRGRRARALPSLASPCAGVFSSSPGRISARGVLRSFAQWARPQLLSVKCFGVHRALQVCPLGAGLLSGAHPRALPTVPAWLWDEAVLGRIGVGSDGKCENRTGAEGGTSVGTLVCLLGRALGFWKLSQSVDRYVSSLSVLHSFRKFKPRFSRE